MPIPFAGDKIPRSAAREREIERMRTEYRQRSINSGGLTRPLRPGHVLAKNETGADLGFGKPAMFNFEKVMLNPNGTPVKEWDPQKFLYRLAPAVHPISDLSYPFCGVAMTTEPIKANEIGVVAISGLAVCFAVASGVGGYFRPADGVVSTSGWGWGKMVATPAGGENFQIVDLSCQFLIARYQITSISGGDINAKIDEGSPNEFTTRIFDDFGIATWQTVGDTGMCQYNGQWQIIVPWCAS